MWPGRRKRLPPGLGGRCPARKRSERRCPGLLSFLRPSNGLPFTCASRCQPDGPPDAGVRWNGWLGLALAPCLCHLFSRPLSAQSVDCPFPEAGVVREDPLVKEPTIIRITVAEYATNEL
jgi:hypothetical protein